MRVTAILTASTYLLSVAVFLLTKPSQPSQTTPNISAQTSGDLRTSKIHEKLIDSEFKILPTARRVILSAKKSPSVPSLATPAPHLSQNLATASGGLQNPVNTTATASNHLRVQPDDLTPENKIGHTTLNVKPGTRNLASLNSNSLSTTEKAVKITSPTKKLPSTIADPISKFAQVTTNPKPKYPVVLQDLKNAILTARQSEVVINLQTDFIQQVGGENQNPSDPAYFQRWVNAERDSYDNLRARLGDTAANQLQLSAAQAAYQSAGGD